MAHQQPSPHSQPALNIKEQDAAPHFPETVDFTLKTSNFLAERAELNYTVVGESITSGLLADLTTPTSTLETSVTLDLRTSYIPPGSQLTYYWKLTSPTGETIDTPAKTLEIDDDGYAWRTLTDPAKRVRVHWYSGSSSFGQKLLTSASGALDKLESQINAGLPRQAEIWIYANGDDLFDALPLHQPEWVGGQAYPAVGVVLASIADDEIADLEIKRTIPHEISHLVLYQAAKNPYNVPPAWLDEGLAVHNQGTPNLGSAQALQEAAQGGWLVPIKALSGSFGADEEEALLAYAESGSVVDFILSDPRYGPDKLAATVAEFKKGVTYDEALKTGLGITTEQLDEQWRASLPYKVAQPGSATRPVLQPNRLPTWLEPLIYSGVAVLATLFLAGGIITLIVVKRNGVKRRQQRYRK
ncbi:MAG: peptidase MA family metallohydrolase [Chloroflexia bacterium]